MGTVGLFVPGLSVPESCASCILCDDECFGSYKCSNVQTWGSETAISPECPLVQIEVDDELLNHS